jgi:glycosyltransferase involved in cell wall biosynthesis
LLISIITPCLNRASLVGEAVESVLSQDYSPVEHIVMDGGSQDGTLEVLARYPRVRVFSESDRSMYEALNKGLKQAGGEVVGFLNGDDLYAQEVFHEVATRFKADPGVDAICGGAEIFERLPNSGERVRSFLSPRYNDLSVRNVALGQPILNARFFRRRVFDAVGLFDPQYRIAGDREFLLRMAFAEIRSEYLPRCVYRYRAHPGSMTFDPSGVRAEATNEEYWRIAEGCLRGSREVRDRLWLKTWHARVSSEMVLQGWRGRKLGKVLAALKRGFRGSLWWPAVLGRRVLLGFAKGLRRTAFARA